MNDFSPISDVDKQQLMSQLCEQLDDAIFILDAEMRYMSVNAAYETMIGYSEDFLLGRPLGIYAAEFLSADERALLQDVSASLTHSGFYERDFSMATRYEHIIDCHMTYRKICIDDAVYYIGMIRDISTVVSNKKKLLHLMNFNQLTGLPNRKIFSSQTNELLMGSTQELVIVRLNIDRYRTIASYVGPDNVNKLIKAFVARIKDLDLDQLLSFSHFGGDDFGLSFQLNDANMIRSQLDSLMQTCEQPFLINGDDIYLQISIGISGYPKDGNQLTSLLNKAEKALHYVKQQGGNDVYWYSDNLDIELTDDLQLEAELREAINACQFIPYYQPKVVLETGEINGFEALVRWQHPTRGLLKPIDFIDAIIKHKLSFELFCQMSLQIAEQLSHWQAMGFIQHVCINADATEFSHPDFFSFINHLFTQHGLHPYQLHIEITESSLMNRHACVKKRLETLKELGIFLALDDFGTGYASLSYLQEYPFDFIKIDKSFISEIIDNHKQYAIVKAILDLGIALNMGVIAEGIETKKQRDFLVQMGCIYGQGYWFGRPAPAEIATKMLIERFIIK